MSGSIEWTKEALWRRRLERFENSDLTVAEFCRVEGVSVPSFYQWRRRLASARASPAVDRFHGGTNDGRFRTIGANQSRPANRVSRAKPGETAAAAFVPVRLTQATAVEVHLPNGTRVCLPSGDTVLLRAAIEAAGRLSIAIPAEASPC